MVRKMVLPTSVPAPILPKNMKKLKFLEIDPLEIARQLTLIESRLYNKVKPAECLGLKWTKPGNDVHAKGIMESINTHNRISAWVAETILQQEDLKKRSALIKHFISTVLARFQREDEDGQTLVEYGLLLALLAIVVIVALLFLDPIVSGIFQDVGNTLDSAGN